MQLEAAWNNFLFWLFIIYPGTSLSSLQIFVCRKISGETYLTADQSMSCPWGYPDGFFDFSTWSPLAFSGAAYVLIYVVGTPTIMLAAMLYHKVPELVNKKIGAGLVSCMIQEYIKETSSASSRRLASFLGMPLGLQLAEELKSDDYSAADQEFRRRMQVILRSVDLIVACYILQSTTRKRLELSRWVGILLNIIYVNTRA